MRILAVVDDYSMVDMIAKTLARISHRDMVAVTPGNEAQSAIATGADRPFDCLLRDASIQKGNCLELCEQIHSLHIDQTVPIFLVAALNTMKRPQSTPGSDPASCESAQNPWSPPKPFRVVADEPLPSAAITETPISSGRPLIQCRDMRAETPNPRAGRLRALTAASLKTRRAEPEGARR